jgi:pyruvate dehydrogenase E1 component
VAECLDGPAPVLAATDYMAALPDGVRQWIDAPYAVLGTDGFGRSDYRRTLRRFFEVDGESVAVGALHALGRGDDAAKALERYGIETETEAPWLR